MIMWTRRHISTKDNVQNNVTFNKMAGLRHANLREPSVVDEFHFDDVVDVSGNKSTMIHDPIYIIFDNQRLNSIGAMGVKTYLDQIQPRSSSLVELRKNVPDDVLMDMMKSRHLQSMSEITAWCRYVNDNMADYQKEIDDMVAEANRIKAEKEAAEQAAQQTVQQAVQPAVTEIKSV